MQRISPIDFLHSINAIILNECSINQIPIFFYLFDWELSTNNIFTAKRTKFKPYFFVGSCRASYGKMARLGQ